MQSCGQQLPSYQSLQEDASNQHNLDLEAKKVSPPSTQADLKEKIAEIDKRLDGGDIICFYLYIFISFSAGFIYVLYSLIHTDQYMVR